MNLIIPEAWYKKKKEKKKKKRKKKKTLDDCRLFTKGLPFLEWKPSLSGQFHEEKEGLEPMYTLLDTSGYTQTKQVTTAVIVEVRRVL